MVFFAIHQHESLMGAHVYPHPESPSHFPPHPVPPYPALPNADAESNHSLFQPPLSGLLGGIGPL